MRALSVILALGVLLSACAPSHPKPGDVIVVEGRVTLKGNEPFAVAVLETEQGHWDLLGLTRSQILEVQSRTVAVIGTVVRAPGDGSPAQLQVNTIR
ncbi:hypothetical protein [Pigmentiphaga sp.]|uniref:hypothetical protein n=1 Tax=Pigmentiphaga sp. TaxID=1977564 RepID=UPI0025F6A722|nr:hypothetical protein [Pigmentiphaga sp.]MBX6320170.1 hypothetical protein [Pigmentiphaga sp.]